MDGLFCIFKFVKTGAKHNVNIGIVLIQFSCQFQSIHIRHFNVRQYHIRLKLFHQLQSLHTVGGASHYVKSQIIPTDLFFHNVDDLYFIIDKNHFILFHPYPPVLRSILLFLYYSRRLLSAE